ncbi:MAG: hypothetical protein GC205_13220 [Bacteroidetes bacterium]|nr:hypothetical protein [Bacteroidota bacterium]
MRLLAWKRSELFMFLLDLVMLVLILFNLFWLLFDGLYSSHFVQEFFDAYWPAFHAFYLPVHQNFTFYDAWFVAIFLTELVIRWFIAAIRKTYHKWWFYPFVHWYDTLGCIPVGSFRFLRVLRIVSILYRLQRNRLIDLTKTYVFRQAKKYYSVLVEEVSDRVVLNVLSGMRDEVQKGSPLTDRILKEVVQPRKAELVDWLSDRIQAVLSVHYDNYRPDLRAYVDEKIERAVSENREIATLEAIPLLGGTIKSTLERAIADIVFRVVDGIVSDLASTNNKLLIDELSGVLFDAILFEEENDALELAVRGILLESLDLVSAEVGVQQWKVREEREAAIRERAKRIAAIREGRRKNAIQ